MTLRRAVAAIVVAALVVTAMPVLAADPGLEVASGHFTASDFGGGSQTNTTVVGTGTAADTRLPDFNDTFESEAADSGAPENWSVGNAPTSVNVTTAHAASGSQSMGVDGTNLGTLEVSRHPLDDPITTNVSISIYAEGGNAHLFVGGVSSRMLTVGMRNGDLVYRNSSGYQTISTTPDNNEWVNITVYNINISSDTYSVRWETPTASGTATGLEFENAQSDGWDDLSVYTDGDVAFYDQVNVEEPPTGTYISANHTASEVEQGWTNLSLRNADATVTWEYWDGSTWQSAGTSTFTTSGNKTIDVTGHASAEKWRVNVTFSTTGTNPNAELQDEGVLFNASTPTVDNASASPTGSLSSSSATLSIGVNDSDFATAQGDSLNVSFYTNRSGYVGSDTLTSNGTATQSHTFATGGDTRWWVEIEDSYAETNRSSNFTVTTPSVVEFRKESDPDTLISGVTVNVTAYYSGETVQRTVTNGKLDLSGFPIDEPIIIRANASGYYIRTTIIEDIYDQSNMYLLNTSKPAYTVRFDLSDPRGEFPRQDTALFIERDLNLSGTTEWRIIAGDTFGVKGVPTDLRQDERFRLTIKNLETGDTVVVGTYTALQDETVTVTSGSTKLTVPASAKNYSFEARENETTQKIIILYNDTANSSRIDTDTIKITIQERYNESNVLVDNATFTNTDSLLYSKSLTNVQVNKTWTAILYIDRGDGFMEFRVPIGSGPRDLIPAILDEDWLAGSGVLIMFMLAMGFSRLNVGVGVITVSLVGGILWWVGVLATVTTGAAVVAAIITSIVFHYLTGGVAQ